MAGRSGFGRFAERALDGVGDDGSPERIVIWIERIEDGSWAVGRAVNPENRPTPRPRRADFLFQGYELEDALRYANDALEDDLRVLEEEGQDVDAAPFTRREIVPLLEARFFRGE